MKPVSEPTKSKAQTLPALDIKNNWSSEVEWDLWMAWFGIDDAISSKRIMHFCKQLASTQKAEMVKMIEVAREQELLLIKQFSIDQSNDSSSVASVERVVSHILDTLNEGKG